MATLIGFSSLIGIIYSIIYIIIYTFRFQKKQTTTFQELKNRALRKITCKKRHDRISCVYKECKILKFPDILNLQNCLFKNLQKCQRQAQPKTRSATHNLLDNLLIPLTKTIMYE